MFQFIKTLQPETALPSVMNYWLHQIQREHYKNEYDFLNAAEISNTPDLIKSLGLYHDPETRLIHCRGGLSNSAMSVSAQFPILLPRRSWLTTLLVRKAHTHVLHGGVADTLSSLREQYWIPRGRQVIKGLLRPCVVCKTIEGRPFKLPGPPSLPKERVTHTEPFHTVGVDYTGSVSIRDPANNNFNKYYICLFTCATTRAIHLELAKDMTATTFINILRRFIHCT